MRENIKQIMARIFERRAEDIPDTASVDLLPEWDSLHHIELMLALEAEFGVRIPTQAMLELVSLAAIEAYLLDPSGVGLEREAVVTGSER